ncbi:MAG: hypothetical protein AB7P07_10330 [Hyphomonadaceae bacterium]
MTLRTILAAASMFALAACNQAQAPAEEAAAPEAPAALMDQVLGMQPDQQPVFAWQQLTTYQASHPEAAPACSSIRAAESRGVIPADVDPASVYGPHAGSLVFSIQCGPQLTGTRFDPREHWLVVFAPGAAEPAVVSCADARGQDICPATMPRAAATP